MHPSISLRSKWRSIAMALVTVGILTVLTASVALAQGHVANDGQTLEMQSPEVQQLYTSVWGDDAAMLWAADHNAAIGQVAPQAQHPRYDDVFHVAYMRSMDMELAGRITADVIARGTIDQFMAGTDMGVLYGYVAPAPQPRAAPSSSSSSTSSAPSTPETSIGSGLFAGRSVSSQRLPVGAVLAAVMLPRANEHNSRTDLGIVYTYDYLYGLTGLPNDLTVDQTDMTQHLSYSGTLTRVGSFTVVYKVTETKETVTPEVDGETLADRTSELTSTSTLTFTITVFDTGADPDSNPRFVKTVSAMTYLAGDYVNIVLPSATGGNGTLTYTVTVGADLADITLNHDGGGMTPRSIWGKATVGGPIVVTYTVRDSDLVPDSHVFTFAITVIADTSPMFNFGAADADDKEGTVGNNTYSLTPAITAGESNGPLKFTATGLPNGLSVDMSVGSRGEISGTPTKAGKFDVSYTVTDNDGDATTENVTITIQPKPVE